MRKGYDKNISAFSNLEMFISGQIYHKKTIYFINYLFTDYYILKEFKETKQIFLG